MRPVYQVIESCAIDIPAHCAVLLCKKNAVVHFPVKVRHIPVEIAGCTGLPHADGCLLRKMIGDVLRYHEEVVLLAPCGGVVPGIRPGVDGQDTGYATDD